MSFARTLQKLDPGHDFAVIEQSSRPGGAVGTHQENGFIVELGPHGFLDNCPESQQLLKDIGLDHKCVKAPLSKFVRYVYLNGKLNLIPQTPRKILMAPLISWPDKLRILGDLCKPPLQGEPTVAKWVDYRFGPALLPYLDAVFTGTYAGDFNRLTIDSVMPGVRSLEKEYGSVLKGLLARMKAARKEGKVNNRQGLPAMTSFGDGMHTLVTTMSSSLSQGENLFVNSEVTSIDRTSDGWSVTTATRSVSTTNLVLCLPINSTLELLAPLDPELPLKSVPQTWITTVAFGFTDDVVIPPGFGFLTPEQENRFLLGTLFSSNMFPDRTPKGHVLIETLVGGRRHPERLALDDKTLTQKALSDVSDILGITKLPVYSRVLRPTSGIPQLEQNYPQLLHWRDEFTRKNPGLFICGFGWGGIGLNDMIKTSVRLAGELADGCARKMDAEIKKIYF